MSTFETEPTRKDNARDRSVTLTWELGETVDYDGKPCVAAAQLYVSHDGNRKAFIAMAQRTNLIQDGHIRIEQFTIGSGTRVRLPARPVARYSAKALEDAVTGSLTALRILANEGQLDALGDPNSPA